MAHTPFSRHVTSFIVCGLVVGALGCDHTDDGTSTGRFSFGRVEGLRYTTETTSGLTDAKGRFHYLPGETVTFSIGGITLGSAPASARISPFDLFDTTPPASEREVRAELRDATDITGFDRAVNVAYLLAALDADAKPSNGIDLSGLDEALAGATMDFDAPLTSFRTGAFRRLAARYHIRRTVALADVIVSLYEALDITVPVHARAELAEDDAAYDHVETYAYDAEGRIVRKGIDWGPNGRVDVLLEWSYDARGLLRMESATSVHDDDGTLESTSSSTFTYADDRLVREVRETDDLDDDAPPRRETNEPTYDAAGNQSVSIWYEDEGADGSIDVRMVDTLTHDDDGNTLTSVRTEAEGEDGVAVPTRRYTYAYDARGRRRSAILEEGDDLDGAVERVTTTLYTLDDHGRELMRDVTLVTTSDAVADTHTITTRTYDASGRLLGVRIVTDDDADGVTDAISEQMFMRDAVGDVLVELDEDDEDADGVIDSRVRTERTFGEDGERRSERVTSDTDGDGVFDPWYVRDYTYTQSADGLRYLIAAYGRDEG